MVAAIAATFFAAGVVKGVTGMGLPTVAMGVLGALLSPLEAAALLLVPSFVTNLWQLLAGPRFGVLLRRLWPMMAAIILGTLAGSALLAGGSSAKTTAGLGLALFAYATYALIAKPRIVSPNFERWASPVIGVGTGLVTGATGVFVVPAVPYIQSLQLDRDDLVQALGLSFTVSTVALATGLLWHHAAPAASLLTSAMAVVPALLGMAAGKALRSRISPRVFRHVFLTFLLLLGLEMTTRALF